MKYAYLYPLVLLLFVRCESKTVALRIKSEPMECKVYIDEQPVGTTPMDIFVTAGEHRITVIHKDKNKYFYDRKFTLAAESAKVIEAQFSYNQDFDFSPEVMAQNRKKRLARGKAQKVWWNDLNDTWKKVFNGHIDKGKVTTTPNQEELERIVNLQELYCSSNQITDLSPLQNLTGLQKLYCYGNQITDAQIQAFKEQHPNCEVTY